MRICEVEGCGKPVHGHGLCKNHWGQQAHKQQRIERNIADPRTCAGCGTPIPPTKRRRGPTSYCSRRCKDTHRDPAQSAASALKSYYKRRYGLTPEQAEEMRERGCDICGTSEHGGRWSKSHIDHDHKTGQVRGVLCQNCNIGIGKFQDNPELLRRAADYIDLVP